jgi:histidine triad (HIT) family protein
MIPPEQIDNIKQQLLSQIENFPEDQRENAAQQIQSMNAEQLEQFLIQNKLVKSDESSQTSPQCIFCSITSGQVPSYKIDENKDALAILEINPISKGHIMILPKEHIETSSKLPQTAFSLAKKIAKKLKSKFKSKDVLISSTNVMGHEALNVIPVYENETIDSPRTKASEDELKELHKKLEKKIRKKVIKKIKTKKLNPKEKIWLPKRIP